MSERLQKLIARSGLASRREAERWIVSGAIKLNGSVAELGAKVTVDDAITINGRRYYVAVEEDQTRRVIMYHKPEGEVVTRHDPEKRKSVFDQLPRLRTGRWISIGRLDINTSGLLLFTDDGELANRLMHPSSEIKRVYAVRVNGEVTDDMIKQLLTGVELEDGPASFDSIVDAGGQGRNHWYHVALREGRNREVRRLWESQGVMVSRLSRISYGSVVLDRGLRPGKFADVPRPVLRELVQATGLSMASSQALKLVLAKPRRHRKR